MQFCYRTYDGISGCKRLPAASHTRPARLRFAGGAARIPALRSYVLVRRLPLNAGARQRSAVFARYGALRARSMARHNFAFCCAAARALHRARAYFTVLAFLIPRG